MCNCKNVDIGSYDNQQTIDSPEWSSWKYQSIDTCLLEEIKQLWLMGVQTNGCCCGHNKQPAYIGVSDDSHSKMIELGYKWYTNKFGSKCYDPKTQY